MGRECKREGYLKADLLIALRCIEQICRPQREVPLPVLQATSVLHDRTVSGLGQVQPVALCEMTAQPRKRS